MVFFLAAIAFLCFDLDMSQRAVTLPVAALVLILTTWEIIVHWKTGHQLTMARQAHAFLPKLIRRAASFVKGTRRPYRVRQWTVRAFGNGLQTMLDGKSASASASNPANAV